MYLSNQGKAILIQPQQSDLFGLEPLCTNATEEVSSQCSMLTKLVNSKIAHKGILGLHFIQIVTELMPSLYSLSIYIKEKCNKALKWFEQKVSIAVK